MLYSKLRYLKNLQEEKDRLEKEKNRTSTKGKNCTSTSVRPDNDKIKDIKMQLDELEGEYNRILSEVNNWLKTANIDVLLKEDIQRFYIEGRSDLYYISNFTRNVEKALNQCYWAKKSVGAEKDEKIEKGK